jgi:hypothetical protein
MPAIFRRHHGSAAALGGVREDIRQRHRRLAYVVADAVHCPR